MVSQWKLLFHCSHSLSSFIRNLLQGSDRVSNHIQSFGQTQKALAEIKIKKFKNKKRIGHCPECQTIFNHLTRDTKGVGWDKKSLNYVQSFQQRGRFKIETVRCSVTRSTNLVSQWLALQCFPQLCGAGECLVLSVACRPAVTFLTAHHLTAIAAVTVCAAVSSLYSSTAADIMSLA